MNKLILCTTFAILAAATTGAQARDKHKDHDDDKHDVYVEQGGERSRTIYVIERDRPVERTVFIDADGHYFQRVDGHRVYIRDHYFESYPTRYYTPQGQRRINITLPF